jgi:hypothetical protein
MDYNCHIPYLQNQICYSVGDKMFASREEAQAYVITLGDSTDFVSRYIFGQFMNFKDFHSEVVLSVIYHHFMTWCKKEEVETPTKDVFKTKLIEYWGEPDLLEPEAIWFNRVLLR